ncbi:hypothetical protein, partial [Megasphaera massiliensis]|uniref:hypothetical protein n=1 Tax=Megasphaera massiliensis TaxID=1232428 RepID=UPI00210D2C42
PDGAAATTIAIRGKITEESYRSLGDGQLVLSFEAESSYVPIHALWDAVLAEWAPNSRYYYYAEVMRLEGLWTNDVYRKYFPWDYVIFASIKKKYPRIHLRLPDENRRLSGKGRPVRLPRLLLDPG